MLFVGKRLQTGSIQGYYSIAKPSDKGVQYLGGSVLTSTGTCSAYPWTGTTARAKGWSSHCTCSQAQWEWPGSDSYLEVGGMHTHTLIRDVPWQSTSLEISKCTVTIA